MTKRYRKYSAYLKEKYGEKVYKLPINLPLTCPNRDGEITTGGCTFCSEIGTAFENLSSALEIKKQLNLNKERIGKKYGAKKFIAYFQNFSNTYMPIEEFEKSLKAACIENIVELSISTRPDCISDAYLQVMDRVAKEKNVNISIELGLQSINHETLRKINRGHTLAELIDAVLRAKKFGFNITVHLIGNLPWDTKEDFIEAAKILSALHIDQIKIHSLFILKDTVLGDQYLNNEFELCSMEEYIERVIEFIRHVKKDIVLQRLLGRAPEDEALFCNWSTSWWKIMNRIEEILEKEDIYQGDRCNYLNGKALNN
ncbi:MAG TPA: TIGR01212 family radical SAM protein [Clostridia bacterium]|nr:TIGR01212 family radical SAM protein [Clostridia bacterium]